MQLADNVQSIRKLGDYSIEIRLHSPDASFLWHLATHYAPILSAEYAQQLTQQDRRELLDRQPVGTGPYRLDEYRYGQYVRLKRNDDYWRGQPRMEQVVVDPAPAAPDACPNC